MYVWRVMTDNRDYDSTVTQESCRETSSRLQTGSVKNFVTVKLLSGALLLHFCGDLPRRIG